MGKKEIDGWGNQGGVFQKEVDRVGYRRTSTSKAFAKGSVAAAAAFTAFALTSVHLINNKDDNSSGVMNMALAQVPKTQEDSKKTLQLWLIEALPTNQADRNHPLNESQSPVVVARYGVGFYDLMLIIRNGAKNPSEKEVFDKAVAKYGSKNEAAKAITDGFMRSLTLSTSKIKSKSDAGVYGPEIAKIADFSIRDMNANPDYFKDWLFIKGDLSEMKDILEGKIAPVVPVGTKAAHAHSLPPLHESPIDTTFLVIHGNLPAQYNIFTGRITPQMESACGHDVGRASGMLDAFLNAKSYVSNFPSGGGNAVLVGNQLANALEQYYAHGNPEKLAAVQPAIDLARKGDVAGALNAMVKVADMNAFTASNPNQYTVSMLPTAISIYSVSANVRINFKGGDDFQDFLNRAKTNPGFLKPLYFGLIYQYDTILLLGRTIGVGGVGGKEFAIGSGTLHTITPALGFNFGTENRPLVLEASVSFRRPDISVDTSIPVIGAGGVNVGDKPYTFQPSKEFYISMYKLEVQHPGFSHDKNDLRLERAGIMLLDGTPLNPLLYMTASYKLGGLESMHIYATPRLGFLASEMFGLGDEFKERMRKNFFVGGDLNLAWRVRLGDHSHIALIPSVAIDYFPAREASKGEVREGRVMPYMGVTYSPARWLEAGVRVGYSMSWAEGGEGLSKGHVTAGATISIAPFDIGKTRGRIQKQEGAAGKQAATQPSEIPNVEKRSETPLASAAEQYRAALDILDSKNQVMVKSVVGQNAAKALADILEDQRIIRGNPALTAIANDPKYQEGIRRLKAGDLEAAGLLRSFPSFKASEGR